MMDYLFNLKYRWRLRTPTECRTTWSLIVELEGACTQWATTSEETYSLIKLIPTDFEESAILFWDQAGSEFEDCWTDKDHFVVTETEKSFEEPLLFQHIMFTGAESYTIFTGTDFTGETQCLQPSDNTLYNGYGLNANEGQFVVGSVRLGCDAAAMKNTIRAEHDTDQFAVVLKKPIIS